MKNKVLAVLLSAVVAFGLWLYVITVVSPESEKTYYEIPVVLQNKAILEERGLMIVSDVPTVTLVLKGNRTTLNDLNEANINVITNVANIDKVGIHNLTYDISLPGNISQNEVTVQNSSTDLVTVKVENKAKRMISVELDYMGTSVEEGFIADLENVMLDHAGIVVSGPESVISRIEKAVIQVNLDGQTQSIVGEYQYTLCNADGDPVNAEMVTTNVAAVNLTIKIQRVKEIALVYDVIEGGGATVDTSTITLEPATIRVSGSDLLLENLNELNVGTINLGEILKDQQLQFPIVLPDGITNETGVDTVTVKVKFPQLMMKTFRVTSITAINVPEGLEVDMITEALDVTVRGPIAMVQAMKSSDIAVTVDFAGVQIGTATMRADVIIDEIFSDIGAVGVYQVSATLQEPDEKGK